MSPIIAPAESTTETFDLVPAEEPARQEFKTYIAEEERRIRWQKLDGVVRRGMEVFVEVGRALAAIKTEELYHHEFPSWDAYCDARLDCGKRTADRLIMSAKVVDDLGVFDKSPSCEAQARELGRLKSVEERQQVWEAVVDDNEIITAVVIKEAVDKIRGTTNRPGVKARSVGRPQATDLTMEAEVVEDTDDAHEVDTQPQPDEDDQVEPQSAEVDTVVFTLADGTEVGESTWTDGAFTRQMLTDQFEEIAKLYADDTERAARMQRLIAVAASALNGEVQADAEAEILSDLHSATHKLQTMATGFCA